MNARQRRIFARTQRAHDVDRSAQTTKNEIIKEDSSKWRQHKKINLATRHDDDENIKTHKYDTAVWHNIATQTTKQLWARRHTSHLHSEKTQRSVARLEHVGQLLDHVASFGLFVDFNWEHETKARV